MAEIRFNARGEQFELGQVAWTRQLYGALASGSYIRQKYGQSPVIEKTPYQVKIRHASQDWTCPTCEQKIDEGDMHGSTFYDHYCLDCVTRSKPETEVEFLKPEVTPIELYRTTRGFAEDAALRTDLETKQGYKFYSSFDSPKDAQEAAKQLTGQDIKFVKHISTPETSEHPTWEIYAKQPSIVKDWTKLRDWELKLLVDKGYEKAIEESKRRAGETKRAPQSQNLYWHSVSELKQMCQQKGLSTEGNKEDLIRRLRRP